MTNSHPVVQVIAILMESGMQAALDRAKAKARDADLPPEAFIEASLAFIVTDIYATIIEEDLETKVDLARDLNDLFEKVMARTIIGTLKMKNVS